MSNANICNFGLPVIHNSHTLNIFSDASMRNIGKTNAHMASCYGSIAVCKDTNIDEIFKLNTDTTVPAAELRGIRLSLDLALRYRFCYDVINIFSDSQLSIFTLRDYFYNWIYDYNTNKYYAKTTIKNGEPAKNQEIVIECINMINELRKTNIVNLYHQKGHVDNNKRDLVNAINVFKDSNHIYGKIDYEVIRYISTYNNYVDNKSRSILNTTNVYKEVYRDPVSFHPVGNVLMIYQDQI